MTESASEFRLMGLEQEALMATASVHGAPFTEPGELALAASLSTAISLKRIAVALERLVSISASTSDLAFDLAKRP